MQNEAEIAHAKSAFINKECLILPNINYLLSELLNLQAYTNQDELQKFDEIFNRIKPEMTVHEVASLLGKCQRDELSYQSNNISHSFLESLHLFCDIEAKIRFSLWPSGLDAPHHFSKLLLTPKVQSIISKEEILCILAILADPKGLNLRNIATHGFSFDTRLSLPLLRRLSSKILPKLPEYLPPNFDFKQELSLLKFHSFRLNISEPIKKNDFSISHFILFSNENHNLFPLLDDARVRSLQLSYELYNEGHFVDSLLLLFPILEHSIRRAAVSLLDLPVDRLCASPDEHFLSIPEALEAFPEDFKNMTTDLLFIPSGPRVRDRIMHGAIREIPQEFAFCIFSIFEKFTQFFNNENENDYKWNFAFHPSRCLEYEIWQACFSQKSEDDEEANKFKYKIDLFKVYNTQSFERLIECVSSLKLIKNSWKDKSIHELFESLAFNRFVCACVLFFTINNVKSGTLQHLNGLVHSTFKFEATNDVARFKKNCETRVKAIKSYLPFIPQNSKCTFSEIEEWINDDDLFNKAMDDVIAKCS